MPPDAPAVTERLGVGVSAVLAAALCTSLSGILVRLVENADGWQILFWRSVFCIATLLTYLLWRHGARIGDRFLSIGRTGLLCSVTLGSSFITFIFALTNTTVANVAFTIGMAPVFAALLGWIFLRERVALRTVGFIALSLGGIALMFSDGLATGGLSGNVLALVTCLFYSGTIVLLRRGRRVDMIPAVTIAAFWSCLVAAAIAPGGLAIGLYDMGIIGFMGVVQLGFQYIFFTAGVRHMPAAQAALLGRATLVLTPFWAFLGVGETPSLLTLAGGGLVLSAVLGQGLSAWWMGRARAV
ncbi:MAG: DMT family transporter [Alphaproteobacteria bacterium]|nr:DMT family transporter [Alphaproteobacteria bacterium]